MERCAITEASLYACRRIQVVFRPCIPRRTGVRMQADKVEMYVCNVSGVVIDYLGKEIRRKTERERERDRSSVAKVKRMNYQILLAGVASRVDGTDNVPPCERQGSWFLVSQGSHGCQFTIGPDQRHLCRIHTSPLCVCGRIEMS